MNDNTDDKNTLLAETAFNLWKAAKMLEDLLWQSFYPDFDELYKKENLKMDLETDLF